MFRQDVDASRAAAQRRRVPAVAASSRGPSRLSRLQPMFVTVDPHSGGRARIVREASAPRGLPALPCHKPKTKVRVQGSLLWPEHHSLMHCKAFVAAEWLAKRTNIMVQIAEESRSFLPPKLMLRLSNFLQQFLASGYGPLMETVRKKLEPGLGISHADSEDFVRFVQLARLCTAFTFIQQVSTWMHTALAAATLLLESNHAMQLL